MDSSRLRGLIEAWPDSGYEDSFVELSLLSSLLRSSEISELKKSVAALSEELFAFRESVTTKLAAAGDSSLIDMSSFDAPLATAPSSDSSNRSRKFNVVVRGISEQPQGTSCSVRFRSDHDKVSDILLNIERELSHCSLIRDCFRLGKYSPDSQSARPILVTLSSTVDVSNILSNCCLLPSSISIRPDLSPQLDCVTPAYLYFQSKFDNELNPAVEAFKVARYVSPSKVNELKPDDSDVDSMRIFPFLDSDCVGALKSELPSYLAAAEDVCENVDIIQWWKNHADRLSKWSSVFLQIVLVQPSSAAAETVFSLLSSSFTSQQESSLEDYIQLSVMLQYNYRKV